VNSGTWNHQGLKNTAARWPVASAILLLSASCLAFNINCEVPENSFSGLWHIKSGATSSELMASHNFSLKVIFVYHCTIGGVKLFRTNDTAGIK